MLLVLNPGFWVPCSIFTADEIVTPRRKNLIFGSLFSQDDKIYPISPDNKEDTLKLSSESGGNSTRLSPKKKKGVGVGTVAP